MSVGSGYRDLYNLSSILKATLWVYVLVAALGVWSEWLELDLFTRVLGGAFATEAEAAASDLRQAAVGVISFVAFLVSAAVFLRWIYISRRNVEYLGAEGLRFTPAWTVGWYFVPVLSAWRPYQALKEVFQASHPGTDKDWRQAPRPSLLPYWWALWLATNGAWTSTYRYSAEASSLEEMVAVSWIELGCYGAEVLLGLSLLSLVSPLQTWQAEKHRRITHSIEPGEVSPLAR